MSMLLDRISSSKYVLLENSPVAFHVAMFRFIRKATKTICNTTIKPYLTAMLIELNTSLVRRLDSGTGYNQLPGPGMYNFLHSHFENAELAPVVETLDLILHATTMVYM